MPILPEDPLWHWGVRGGMVWESREWSEGSDAGREEGLEAVGGRPGRRSWESVRKWSSMLFAF